jgi:hypothetical protein
MTEIDAGDLCLTCGRSTRGDAPFVNRVPSSGYARGDIHPAVAAAFPGGPKDVFDGYWCADCQSDECEACQAEGNDWIMPDTGKRFDPKRYIGATGGLCDSHTAMVVCARCGEDVEPGEAATARFVKTAGTFEMRHRGACSKR